MEQAESGEPHRGINTLALVDLVKDFKSNEFILRAIEVGEDPDSIYISKSSSGYF